MVYYLLSKEDFAALYKFGEVNVKVGAFAESEDPREAVKRIFSTSDSFEYAQERLIVSSEKGSPGTVRMVDVKDIFPLDGISRNLFKSQFNSSLIFGEPVFQDIAEDFLKNTVLERTTVSGINALRTVFGLEPEKDEALIGDIIKGKSYLRRYKYFDIPFEVRTPYSMLIAYNRYQHYPKDCRGFFYDAADCFMYGSMYSSLTEKGINLLGYDREIVARLCHSFFDLLETIPSNIQFTRLVSILEESKPKISEAIAPVYGSIRFLALYFYLKELIREEDTVSMMGLSRLNSVGKCYPEDFPRLLTLLGGFFGYTWVYDRLYEFQYSPFLSTHHSISDFRQKESADQHEPVPAPLSEESASGMPDQCESMPDDSNVPPAVKREISQPVTLSPEPRLETIDHVVPEESAQDESAASQPDTPQASAVSGLDPAGKPVGESVNPISSLDSSRDDGTDIDIPKIVKALFRNNNPRRKAFEKALADYHDEVLQFVKEKDEISLRGLYMKLDKNFKPATESQKQDKFVEACFASLKLALH